jgi:hypothetical protein
MRTSDESISYDYSIHSDYLIHWTGKDIDCEHDKKWHESDKSKTNRITEDKYLKRLHDILKFGLWMTKESDSEHVPAWPKCCFTELKISESRRHARRYGRLGIGVKRPFLFDRYGRPLVYFGFRDQSKDKLLYACADKFKLEKPELMSFFKPMNNSGPLTYELYAESEWRLIFFEELLKEKLIVDPRNAPNEEVHNYFQSLNEEQQQRLKYLVPLDGWFQMIIYPSLSVKNKAQQNQEHKIFDEIKRIKALPDHGNRVEGANWPVEVNLDACRNF